jgi:hypothetical protein
MNKNEAKTEDMVEIMAHYQNYCPVINDKIKPIILGGDGLTCERAHDAWLARSDGLTDKDRLNGLIIKAEDWHKNAIICRQVNAYFIFCNNIVILCIVLVTKLLN